MVRDGRGEEIKKEVRGYMRAVIDLSSYLYELIYLYYNGEYNRDRNEVLVRGMERWFGGKYKFGNVLFSERKGWVSLVFHNKGERDKFIDENRGRFCLDGIDVYGRGGWVDYIARVKLLEEGYLEGSKEFLRGVLRMLLEEAKGKFPEDSFSLIKRRFSGLVNLLVYARLKFGDVVYYDDDKGLDNNGNEDIREGVEVIKRLRFYRSYFYWCDDLIYRLFRENLTEKDDFTRSALDLGTIRSEDLADSFEKVKVRDSTLDLGFVIYGRFSEEDLRRLGGVYELSRFNEGFILLLYRYRFLDITRGEKVIKSYELLSRINERLGTVSV